MRRALLQNGSIRACWTLAARVWSPRDLKGSGENTSPESLQATAFSLANVRGVLPSYWPLHEVGKMVIKPTSYRKIELKSPAQCCSCGLKPALVPSVPGPASGVPSLFPAPLSLSQPPLLHGKWMLLLTLLPSPAQLMGILPNLNFFPLDGFGMLILHHTLLKWKSELAPLVDLALPHLGMRERDTTHKEAKLNPIY